MKKQLALIAALTALGAIGAQAYDGTVVYNGRVGLGDGTGGGGGAFQLTATQQVPGTLLTGYQVTGQAPANGANQFLAFCLELSENISSGPTYYYDINTAAVKGGTTTSDPLDFKTAWLFSKFVDGSLSTAVGTFTYDNAGGNALQNAIWALEGEATLAAGVATDLVNAATTANPSSLGNVRVLNLWTTYNATTGALSGHAQDMLVVVPEPSTYIAGGLALLPLLFGLRARLVRK